MNEIERAIQIIERQKLQIGIDYTNGKDLTAICLVGNSAEIALTALSEKAERSKGCEFCCYIEYPGEKLYPKEDYVFYAGFSKQVDVDTFDEDEVEKISYCPMCGRKLEEALSDGGRI